VRTIANEAGVSPGLIIHHFGSKDGLVGACDERIAGVIEEGKSAAMQTGPSFDVLGSLRQSGGTQIMRFLARRLTDESGAVADLVDRMVEDATAYLTEGVESGMLRSTSDPAGRAAILTIWSLGALVLNDHLTRLVGTDLMSDTAMEDGSILGYFMPATEILAEGIVTAAMAAQLREAFAGMADEGVAGDPGGKEMTA
jgi:AcrR family transcriptional regulator